MITIFVMIKKENYSIEGQGDGSLSQSNERPEDGYLSRFDRFCYSHVWLAICPLLTL